MLLKPMNRKCYSHSFFSFTTLAIICSHTWEKKGSPTEAHSFLMSFLSLIFVLFHTRVYHIGLHKFHRQKHILQFKCFFFHNHCFISHNNLLLSMYTFNTYIVVCLYIVFLLVFLLLLLGLTFESAIIVVGKIYQVTHIFYLNKTIIPATLCFYIIHVEIR